MIYEAPYYEQSDSSFVCGGFSPRGHKWGLSEQARIATPNMVRATDDYEITILAPWGPVSLWASEIDRSLVDYPCEKLAIEIDGDEILSTVTRTEKGLRVKDKHVPEKFKAIKDK